MSIPSRSYRGPSNSAFLGVNNNDKGIGTFDKKVGPFELPKPDKSGSHAISTWNALQCKSNGESIYSDNIKRSVNGSTSTNPNIIKSDIIQDPPKPKPERFVYDDRLARIPSPSCNCGAVFMENTDKILEIGPIVIGILMFIAVCTLLWIVIKKYRSPVTNIEAKGGSSNTITGGFIDEDAIDII